MPAGPAATWAGPYSQFDHQITQFTNYIKPGHKRIGALLVPRFFGIALAKDQDYTVGNPPPHTSIIIFFNYSISSPFTRLLLPFTRLLLLFFFGKHQFAVFHVVSW